MNPIEAPKSIYQIQQIPNIYIRLCLYFTGNPQTLQTFTYTSCCNQIN